MILAAILLVGLALVVMRVLMRVVARDERTTPAAASAVEAVVPGVPAPELRARADDGVRAFLSPATEPEIVGPVHEHDQPADRERSARP